MLLNRCMYWTLEPCLYVHVLYVSILKCFLFLKEWDNKSQCKRKCFQNSHLIKYFIQDRNFKYKKANNTTEKQANCQNRRQRVREDIQTAGKNMMFSITCHHMLYVVCHCTHMIDFKDQITDTTKYQQGNGATGMLMCCWWDFSNVVTLEDECGVS